MSTPNILNKEDKVLDQTLRPQRWEDYIGQESIKNNLKILIQAAKNRNETLEHLLFYGPAGLGKTTLVHLIAKETGAQIKITSGPTIERVGDLASILTNLSPGDILFIDEAHRLNKMIEEVLYPAMETGTIDIIIGKGPSARSLQLELPPFTLMAATTRIALLSAPLRSRFSGGTFRLEFYNEEEIKKIILNSAKKIGVEVTEDAAKEIAKRCRFTPRIANHLLKRARDFADVHGNKKVDLETAQKAMALLDIDKAGLNTDDRKFLEILIDKFAGGPTGLQTLASALSEDVSTLEEVYEPYLLRLGFLERTPRGRVATVHAYEHLNRTMSQRPLI
jgi:Holliday junction DNA helicase RuvB